MAISVVSWFLSEQQISAGEGSAPVGDHGAFHLHLLGLSELLALGMVSQGCYFQLPVLHRPAPLQPGHSCPSSSCLCLSIAAASALLPLATGV